MKRAVIVLCGMLVLAGCSTQVVVTGTAYPPVDPKKVQVLYEGEPICDFEQTGMIQTKEMFGAEAVVNELREKAASIGADYLYVRKVSCHAFNECEASGVTYKCLPEDAPKQTRRTPENEKKDKRTPSRY